MRLSYAPATAPESADESTKAIYARIAARRNPRPVTKLDRALLHNPAIANGWNELLGAIRTRTTLSPAIAELAICRIAVLNNAVYEWSAHAPLAMKAGVTAAELEVVRAAGAAEEKGEGLSREQWAVLAYTDAMTREVVVRDGVFGALREWFDERQIVELTATVATYNCVSRFLVALDVCEMNGEQIKVPDVP